VCKPLELIKGDGMELEGIKETINIMKEMSKDENYFSINI